MNQYSTEPEYSVEELAKIPHMVNKLVSSDLNFKEVVAELAQLSVELDSVLGILGKIQDSVLVLRLSLVEPL